MPGSVVENIPVDLHYAICLLVTVGWTTLFSLTIKQPLRGLRNLGILASYVLLIVMLFRLPMLAAIVTWCVYGIAGGLLYGGYELLSRAGTQVENPNSPKSLFGVLAHGFVAWPIMIPEAIEYTLAQWGVLPGPSVRPPENQGEPPPSAA
ncbi:MAG TPA: hypothetical protein VGP63_25430 [Planctomycetaceae bacterium]|nr:hypothetical protein [Planctomycetaceae bacterium]